LPFVHGDISKAIVVLQVQNGNGLKKKKEKKKEKKEKSVDGSRKRESGRMGVE
jgi:hypothetical protein